MMTTWMRRGIGATAVVLLAATAAPSLDRQPMVVSSLAGTLNVQQNIPCDGHINTTTTVNGGRLELTPSEGVDVVGGKIFSLARGTVSFAPFSMSGSCLGFSRTRSYTELAVQLAHSVTFTATAAGGGLYNVTIPKEDFIMYEAGIVNGDQETATKVPKEDVTGTINLTTGAVTMHVAIATKVHFEAGCAFGVCVIDETDSGTTTADLTGMIVYPDNDADGVPDKDDNCPLVANADQTPVPTPVISPPPDATVHSCLDHAFGLAVAQDVCNAGPVAVTNDAPATLPVGPSTVTWRGEDSIGRIATATQTVTVVDTTTPVFTFVPGPISMNNCGPAVLGTPIATDDCAPPPAITNNAPAIFLVGTTTVTWTATDGSGNQSHATQIVTVVDTVAPTVSCTLENPTGSSFRVHAFDACGTPAVRLGSFSVADGELIKINQTGQPGVRLVNEVSSDGIRHFQVGKGQAIIVATDGSGNVTTAVCR